MAANTILAARPGAVAGRMGGDMKVRIDTDRCSGHGRCYTLAPDVFDCDDRGYGSVKGDGEFPVALKDQAELAEQSCPEQAVAVTD